MSDTVRLVRNVPIFAELDDEVAGWVAEAYEGAGRKEDAAKYLMMVSLLYKDDALVPPIMAETIRILDELGRKEDASSIRDDLVATYPESKEAADVKRSTPEAAK